MNELTPQQVATLTGGGDCFDHWHSSDRAANEANQGAASNVPTIEVNTNTTLPVESAFVIVDTGAASITITLPLSNGGVEIEIVKNHPANRMIIACSGSNTILARDSLIAYNYGTAVRLKAISNGWLII